jgi:hypothetical protein
MGKLRFLGSGNPFNRSASSKTDVGPTRDTHQTFMAACTSALCGGAGIRGDGSVWPVLALSGLSVRPHQCNIAAMPQHFLNFFPLPQGQGSLRPVFGCSRW